MIKPDLPHLLQYDLVRGSELRPLSIFLLTLQCKFIYARKWLSVRKIEPCASAASLKVTCLHGDMAQLAVTLQIQRILILLLLGKYNQLKNFKSLVRRCCMSDSSLSKLTCVFTASASRNQNKAREDGNGNGRARRAS
eukprot:753776-Hanusia_phi.AAC.12